MKTIIRHLSFVILLCSVHGQDFTASFTAPTNAAAAGVQTYSLWAQATNAPGAWHWTAQCNVGGASIDFASTNCPANPCWLTVTSDTATNNSPGCTPFLFDVKNFPIATPPPALMPPSLLMVRRK